MIEDSKAETFVALFDDAAPPARFHVALEDRA